MIQRVLAVGLIAGLVAGLAIAALQQVTTTPLIFAAEVYEASAQAHDAVADEGWKPAEGFQRLVATGVADFGLAAGYALILLGAMLLSGERVEPKRALCWAACGFAATGLATALGLPPQLPGAAEGDLIARQIWWVATAIATGAGLFVLLRRDEFFLKAFGALLLLAPHVVGAPLPVRPESTVPAEFAARFAASSLTVQAVMWSLVGVAVGATWRRFAARDFGATP